MPGRSALLASSAPFPTNLSKESLRGGPRSLNCYFGGRRTRSPRQSRCASTKTRLTILPPSNASAGYEDVEYRREACRLILENENYVVIINNVVSEQRFLFDASQFYVKLIISSSYVFMLFFICYYF